MYAIPLFLAPSTFEGHIRLHEFCLRIVLNLWVLRGFGAAGGAEGRKEKRIRLEKTLFLSRPYYSFFGFL